MDILQPDSLDREGVEAGRPVEPVVSALQSLYRAYQKSAVYPAGHPSIPEAIDRAAGRLEASMESREALIIGVTPDHLCLDEQRLVEAGELLESLAGILHEQDVAAVEFHCGVRSFELEAFIEVLARAQRERLKGHSFRQALRDGNVKHIRIRPVDYAALQFEAGLHGDDSGADETWEALSRALTEPDGLPAEGIGGLAGDIDRTIGRHEGAGAGRLRERVHSVVSRLGEFEGEQRESLRRRLSEFVNALSPGLRRDLLRLDPYALDIPLALLNELAEDLPAPELLEALEQVDRAAGKAPDELLILLNKLVRTCEGNPNLDSKLRETLADWGVSPDALSEDRIGLQEALEEIFLSRSESEFNPEAYQALLENLSRHNLEGLGTPSVAKYRNPADPLDVRLHAAELAVALLGLPDGEKHRTGLFGYVGSQTDMLLDHCKFTVVHEATLAARTDKLLQNDCHTTRKAAAGYLAGFEQIDRIDRILSLAMEGKGLPADAINLLRMSGEVALSRTIDLLGSDTPPELGTALRGFILEQGGDRLELALRERLHSSWSAMKPVFRLIAALPDDAARPLLEILFDHSEFGVRRDALRALCEREDPAGNDDRYLARAMDDPNHRVVLTASRRLAERGDARSLDRILRYILGELPCGRPTAEDVQRLADFLIAKGEPGLSRLCLALTQLSKHTRLARTTYGLVGKLRPYRAHAEVGEALARWKRSPAGLLRFFISDPANAGEAKS